MQAQGYVKGRPVSLAVLDYGLFKVHANGRVIGICGYLISTDAGEHVLIDTGFPAKYAEDAAAASTEDRLFAFGEVLHCGPENLPVAQLGLLGLSLSDVTLHVVSHTHIDHIGGLHGFAGVPILISEIERALPAPLYWGDVRGMEWPDAAYILLRGDVDLGPGFRVFTVPGHAPGQLAFMLELPETGAVLLTSDAISRPAEVDERFEGSWDAAMAMASAERILAEAAAREAMVIYGHCPAQWAGLRKAPEVYL